MVLDQLGAVLLFNLEARDIALDITVIMIILMVVKVL